MLRTYFPILHPIATLHEMLEHLICEVWCKADKINNCIDLLHSDFKKIYEYLDWLKSDVDYIFEHSRALETHERQSIIDAFKSNNQIENLCNGVVKPIELSSLPSVVEMKMKPLLEVFYSRLLDIKKVPGEKLDYYNQLVKSNNFKTCPVCGLANIENPESRYIEDYDHFLPKAYYPFAAVNFKNLVPTCDKCNKKHKGGKKPLDKNGKAYYPFESGRPPINIKVTLKTIDFDSDQKLTQMPKFQFSGDADKNETWNWLYNIESRYSDEFKRFSYSWLRNLKKEIEFNESKSAEQYIDFKIRNYKEDEFDEMKFLKIALLEEVKTKQEWMEVYSQKASI